MPSELNTEHVMSDEERELLARSARGANAGSDFDFQDEYPPPPTSYLLDQEPRRRTNYCRLFFVACSIVAACTAVAALVGGGRSSTCTSRRSEQCFGDAVLSAMDRSADPCNNFYEYACGSWLRKQVIPADRSSFGRSFTNVFNTIRDDLREMLEKDLQNKRHPQAISGRLYTSCMHDVATGPVDVSMLRPFRSIFDGLVDSSSFSRALAVLHGALSSAMFDIDIGVDEKNPESYAVSFSQGGIGLSHPDKYTSMKDSDVKLRAAYLKLTEQHLRVAAKAKLVPKVDFAQLAIKSFEFETRLASIHKPPEDRRNPDEMYHPTNVTDFPQPLHFATYLQQLGIDSAKIHNIVVVEDPDYVREVSNMIAQVNVGNKDLLLAVKGYLAFRLVRHFGSKGMMGKEVDDNEFEFSVIRTGVKQQPERWKRCQSTVSRYLGDSLGAAFVEKHFPKERKAVAERLAREITRSFGENLDELEWMDDTTRAAAKEKLSAIRWKVGYTRKFDKYPGVKVTKRDYGQNLVNLMKYAKNYSIGRLGKPVDKTEWSMVSLTSFPIAPPLLIRSQLTIRTLLITRRMRTKLMRTIHHLAMKLLRQAVFYNNHFSLMYIQTR